MMMKIMMREMTMKKEDDADDAVDRLIVLREETLLVHHAA